MVGNNFSTALSLFSHVKNNHRSSAWPCHRPYSKKAFQWAINLQKLHKMRKTHWKAFKLSFHAIRVTVVILHETLLGTFSEWWNKFRCSLRINHSLFLESCHQIDFGFLEYKVNRELCHLPVNQVWYSLLFWIQFVPFAGKIKEVTSELS